MFWKYLFVPRAVLYHEELLRQKELPPWKQSIAAWLQKLIDETYAETRRIEDQFTAQWRLGSSFKNLKEATEFLKLLSEVTGYKPIKKVIKEEKYLSSWYDTFRDIIGLGQLTIAAAVHEYAHHITFRDLRPKESVKFWFHIFRYGIDHNEVFLAKEKEIFDLLLDLQAKMIQNSPFSYLRDQHTVVSLLQTAKLTNHIKKTWTIK